MPDSAPSRASAASSTMTKIHKDDLPNWPVELLRIADPVEAEKLSSVSWDTIVRNHRDKVVHVSKRRVGMRVGHALLLRDNSS